MDRRGRPAPQPDGAKGIGETGIAGTAAAIANAVHHATGRRIRDLPVTHAKLVSEGLNQGPAADSGPGDVGSSGCKPARCSRAAWPGSKRSLTSSAGR